MDSSTTSNDIPRKRDIFNIASNYSKMLYMSEKVNITPPQKNSSPESDSSRKKAILRIVEIKFGMC
jgi:hypothetical protein